MDFRLPVSIVVKSSSASLYASGSQTCTPKPPVLITNPAASRVKTRAAALLPPAFAGAAPPAPDPEPIYARIDIDTIEREVGKVEIVEVSDKFARAVLVEGTRVKRGDYVHL